MPMFRVPITINYSGGGGPAINVFHVDSILPADTEDVDNAIDALAAFYQGMAGYLPSGTVVTFPAAVAAQVATGGEFEAVVAATEQAAVTGNPAGAPLPRQVAAVVSWRSGLTGRANRGRTYFGPLTTSAVSGGESLSVDFTNELRTRANQILASFTPAGLRLMILHRADNTGTAVSQVRIGSRPDTQRRRLPRSEPYS